VFSFKPVALCDRVSSKDARLHAIAVMLRALMPAPDDRRIAITRKSKSPANAGLVPGYLRRPSFAINV
jgi:hypothetical protein